MVVEPILEVYNRKLLVEEYYVFYFLGTSSAGFDMSGRVNVRVSLSDGEYNNSYFIRPN